MSSLVAWALYDDTGAPLVGAAPSWVDYCDRAASARTRPSIVSLGGNLYGFLPTDADESTGSAYLIDNGAGANPRRVSGSVSTATSPFTAWHLEDATGTLWTGAAPTITTYASIAGARTSPGVTSIKSYLFAVTPSTADAAIGVSFRADSATDAWPLFLQDVLVAAPSSGPNVAYSPGAMPDALAVSALREYLLRYLPAKVAALNALRPAVLKSALASPFTVPSGAQLVLANSREGTTTTVTITSGTRTATQVAADITAAAPTGLTASVDEAGRVVLTSTATPAPGAPSVVSLRSSTTGGNEALGWAAGGEHSDSAALVAPSWRGVVDGRPIAAPDMGQGFWVMLGDRVTRPTHPGIRRDTYDVSISVDVWRPFGFNATPHRNREAISACVRAVRELLEATDGRYLGRQWANDIGLVTLGTVTIQGDPVVIDNTFFDTAKFTLNCRVFQRLD